MVLKYKYQGLHRVVCNSLDILRKGIQTLSGFCGDMGVMAYVQFLTKTKQKQIKNLQRKSYRRPWRQYSKRYKA